MLKSSDMFKIGLFEYSECLDINPRLINFYGIEINHSIYAINKGSRSIIDIIPKCTNIIIQPAGKVNMYNEINKKINSNPNEILLVKFLKIIIFKESRILRVQFLNNFNEILNV